MHRSDSGSGSSRILAVVVGLLVCLTLAGSVHASTFLFNTVMNGAAPSSSAPWLIADFQTISPGTVQLTLRADLEVAAEFISEVDFNVNPAIVPSGLTIVQTPGQVPAAIAIGKTTQNAQNPSGTGAAGKGFDVSLDWTTANSLSGRFDGTDVVSFLITSSGLTSSDFDVWTNSGAAHAILAAHIQGIPASDGRTTSGEIMNGTSGTPEPSTVFLVSGAVFAFAVLRKRAAVR